MILYEASNPAHLRPIEDALLPGVDLGTFMNPPDSIKIGSEIKPRDGMDLCIKCFNNNKPSEVAIRSLAYHAKHESGNFSITKFWESLCWHAQNVGGPYEALLKVVISMGRFAVMRNPLGGDLMGDDASRNIQNLTRFIPRTIAKEYGGKDGAHEAAVRFSREVGARLLKRKANAANFREGINEFIKAIKLASNPKTVQPNRLDNPTPIELPKTPGTPAAPAAPVAPKTGVNEGLFLPSPKKIAHGLLTKSSYKSKKLPRNYNSGWNPNDEIKKHLKQFGVDLAINTKLFSKHPQSSQYYTRVIVNPKNVAKQLGLSGIPEGMIVLVFDIVDLHYTGSAYSASFNLVMSHYNQYGAVKKAFKLKIPPHEFRNQLLIQAKNAGIYDGIVPNIRPDDSDELDPNRDFAFVSDENSPIGGTSGFEEPTGDELKTLIAEYVKVIKKRNGRLSFKEMKDNIQSILEEI
jgi:hypothetical protein